MQAYFQEKNTDQRLCFNVTIEKYVMIRDNYRKETFSVLYLKNIKKLL